MTVTSSTEPVVEYADAVGRYDPVIGLEVHVELNTATKMFCGCATTFGAEPNSQVCPVCLGLPGSLPVVNATAVESAIRIGLALNCTIAAWCRFARKNYFYPDMPKNFQTSQYDEPIAYDGYLDVELADGEVFRVEVERAHMEEDTGKSLHVGGATGRIHGAEYSLVDYNRAGIPLIEIVTKTVTGAGERAPEVARAYVSALRELLRALDVSDVRMEQGSLRCDANVSLRPRAQEQASVPFGTRTETKNVNSLRSVERAVRYEITRHAAVLDGGEKVVQETRHWHEDTGVTTSGRVKSDAEDYRYFPEPDLVPVAPPPAEVERLRSTLPEAPSVRHRRLQLAWGYTDLQMRDVVNAGAVELVEETVAAGASPAGARKWWSGELARRANAEGRELTDFGVTPLHVAELDGLVASGRLNDAMARQVFEGVLAGEGNPAAVAEARGLRLVSDTAALAEAVDAVIVGNPDVAAKVRGGKVQAVGALIGQVMRQLGGQADAAAVRQLLLDRLGGE
ncbi:MAG TPA: Asp-tRNA(Asn)/Glu-tRNA(Gln) amidotransferase subunit GatB [Dermatophilaceae bacterium]|nr:Asp-tRNA(Asn)/Glu-tRNA(Gln) amidotransferase subunit GatB [Dermatophilaceae bacterium]